MQNISSAIAPPAPGNDTQAATRSKFIGFARDEPSARLLGQALQDILPGDNHIHIVDFRATLAILAEMTTPQIILVDLSGEDQPINAMTDLAEVVEPGTLVLAIGESQNVSFYRTVTKGMGVREYLAKPLTRAAVEENFIPAIANVAPASAAPRGGRLVTLAGARGGVGASTIASNLAWLIGTGLHRHTVLLDAELHTGTTALNLNVETNNGLGIALESPQRVDSLLIERSIQPAGERVHVLAGHIGLEQPLDYAHESAGLLVTALRTRYNFVIADAGARFGVFARDLIFLAQQRVVVMDPSMIAIRNLERLLALPSSAGVSPRALLVLNRAGTPGGLSQHYMEQNMGLRFDAVIPDLPRIVPKTTQFGEQAAALRGPYRSAILTLASALGASAPEAA